MRAKSTGREGQKTRMIPVADAYYPVSRELYMRVLLGRKEGFEYVLLGEPKEEIDSRLALLLDVRKP